MLIKLLIASIIITFILLYFYAQSGIKLPPETNKVVAEILNGEGPELVDGETGFAKSGNLDIWYERINPEGSTKGTVLLVMGLSSSAMLWTKHFYQVFVDAGYQVIRYDNRDIGLSTWIKDWNRNNPYSLEDMAKDGMAVLDAAGVDKAHIVGASMGGMIAQRMAISHSNRVLTLTSIMSSGYMLDPDIRPVSKSYSRNFIKLGLRYLIPGGEAGAMKFSVAIQQSLRGDGPYELDVRRIAEIALYEVRNRRGFNRKAINQHSIGIKVSGSRLEELKSLALPTLVIHGKSDPLVFFDHAQKYAPLIPNAEIIYIDGMGHDLPSFYMKQIHKAILSNLNKV